MNILVTGATGFAGGYIMKYLKERFPESQIAGTGRNPEKLDQLRKEGFPMYSGDLSDPAFIRSELSSFTHVIHSAARSSIWGDYPDFYKDNVLVTKNLLDNISELQRFIYISTANIYFNFKDRLDVREDDPLPLKYISNYPKTKLMAEQIVLSSGSDNLHTISLRPRGIIGPGDSTSMPRILKAYMEDKIKIIGKGKNIIDFTSIKNLAYATELSLLSPPETSGRAYNITDGETFGFWSIMKETMKSLGYEKEIGRLPYGLVYCVASLSETMAKLRGGHEPTLTRYAVGVMKSSFTLNIERAQRELGYKAVISTKETINEYLDWYLQQNK